MAVIPTYEQIEDRVVETLVSFGVHREDIRADARLEKLDVDSLDVIELAQVIKSEFHLELEARDFVDVRTFGDVMEAIRRRAGL